MASPGMMANRRRMGNVTSMRTRTGVQQGWVRTALVAGVIVLAAGCSQVRGAVDDALSAGLRTAASSTLRQAAESQGFPLKGDPDCTGGVTTESNSADISCQAETQTGLPVSGRAKVSNVGKPDCVGEMTVTIGDQPPFTQKFPGCTS